MSSHTSTGFVFVVVKQNNSKEPNSKTNM